MSRHVLIFSARFADAVAECTKRQTIRPVRKRPIKAGHALVLYAWTGKPYRSKQRRLYPVARICKEASEITIASGTIGGAQVECIHINGRELTFQQAQDFAKADGFINAADMVDWFKKTHGLPFTGTLIKW